MTIKDSVDILEKELAELKRQRRIRELQAEIDREKGYKHELARPPSSVWLNTNAGFDKTPPRI